MKTYHTVCPLCGGPHNLSKCPHWIIPPEVAAQAAHEARMDAKLRETGRPQ